MCTVRFIRFAIFALALIGPIHATARPAAPADSTGALAVDPAKADEYLEQAWLAASRDQHETSIYWFRKALAARPSLASEVGKALGYQYTWAERPDSGVIWFQRYLDDHPDDVEARLGVARATSWSDRLGDALALYDSVLADHPDNLDAGIGRAQTINWSGRHREAAALYSEMLSLHPENNEIRSGLAQAYQWMGRPDLAAEIIDVDIRPASLDEIARDIDGVRAPAASYGYAANEDSDDIERQRHEVRGSFSPGYLTRTQGYYSHWRIRQPGVPDVNRDQFKALLNHRFSNMLALSVDIGYEWNSFDRSALPPQPFWQDEFNLFVMDAYLTLLPRDYLRVDFGLFRGSLDNPEPIFRGIRITDISAGLDWRFSHTLMSTGAAAYTDYSDGNSRVSVLGKLIWNPIYQLPIGVKNRIKLITYAGYFGFSEQLNHGYFDPDNYLSIYERMELDLNFHDRLRLMLGGNLGFENDDFNEWLFVGSIDGYVTARIVGNFSLTAGYYNTQSRLETRSGYQADGWYLTLDLLLVR